MKEIALAFDFFGSVAAQSCDKHSSAKADAVTAKGGRFVEAVTLQNLRGLSPRSSAQAPVSGSKGPALQG